jgi:hypothetical protein
MNKRKSENLGSFEDLISIGALLRPTIEQAVKNLEKEDRAALGAIIILAEKQLANSQLSLTTRFHRVLHEMETSFQYGATWRFVSARIQNIAEAPQPGIKELNTVSLILGMIFDTLAQQKNEQAA